MKKEYRSILLIIKRHGFLIFKEFIKLIDTIKQDWKKEIFLKHLKKTVKKFFQSVNAKKKLV